MINEFNQALYDRIYCLFENQTWFKHHHDVSIMDPLPLDFWAHIVKFWKKPWDLCDFRVGTLDAIFVGACLPPTVETEQNTSESGLFGPNQTNQILATRGVLFGLFATIRLRPPGVLCIVPRKQRLRLRTYCLKLFADAFRTKYSECVLPISHDLPRSVDGLMT